MLTQYIFAGMSVVCGLLCIFAYWLGSQNGRKVAGMAWRLANGQDPEKETGGFPDQDEVD